MGLAFDPPIVINVRDRVTHLRALVAWLEKAGHERITILDNRSSYEPLLDYLAATPHTVVRLAVNQGSRAIWNAGLVPDEPFVYSDPDLLPVDECPTDTVAYLHELLQRHPEWPKAGLGLYLDDVPDTVTCLAHERSLIAPGREVERGVFGSLIDTTFALYRPGVGHGYAALRTGFPYVARHASWYSQDDPSDEDLYYLERATPGPEGSSWAFARQLDKERAA